MIRYRRSNLSTVFFLICFRLDGYYDFMTVTFRAWEVELSGSFAKSITTQISRIRVGVVSRLFSELANQCICTGHSSIRSPNILLS